MEQSRFIVIVGKKAEFRFPYDINIINAIKERIPGRRWDSDARCWIAPFNEKTQEAVLGIGKDFGFLGKNFPSDIVAKLEAKKAHANLSALQRAQKVKSIIEALPFAPFAHQLEAIKEIAFRGSCVIAFQPGLGKTLTSLVAAQIYGHPIYVAAPPSIHENWMREAEAIGANISGIFTPAKIPDFIPQPYTFIADEAHYYQAGNGSQRGKKFLKIAANAELVLPLTGTPMPNGRPIQMFPLLKSISHPITLDRKFYEKEFCDAGPTKFSSWDTSGAKNLHILNERIKDRVFYKTKRDCVDLPEVFVIPRPVETSESAEKIYQDFIKSFRSEWQNRVSDSKVSPEAEAVVMLNKVRQAASLAKVEASIELIRELVDNGEQVLVFSSFIETLKRIHAEFRNQCGVITGETPQDQRQQSVDEFQSGAKRIMVLSYGAGGVGLNLQAADSIVMVDRAFEAEKFEQAIARAHRIGRTGSVSVFLMKYELLDEHNDDRLAQKNRVIIEALSGNRRTMRAKKASNFVELANLIFNT